MADTIRASTLPQTASYDPASDYFMILRGNADGPVSGPYLLFASSVVATGGSEGGGGGDYGFGGGPFGGGVTVSVTSVYGRKGVVEAQIGDYTAAKITYSAGATGIPAVTVQEAIDYIATYGGGGGGGSGLPVGGSEGQIPTRDGGGGVVWADQAVITVFGRDGIVAATAGDYHADQISLTTDGTTPTVNRFVTASDIAKITSLNLGLLVPDPSVATIGHVLKVGAGNVQEWAAESGGGGGGFTQIDLMPHLRPDSASPPTWVYEGGAGTWQFADSGTQTLHAEFRWPGGSNKIELITSAAATTGNAKFAIHVAAVTSDSTDLYDRAYVGPNVASVVVRGTLKQTKPCDINLNTNDSATAGDMVRIKISRDNTVGTNAVGIVTLRLATMVPQP